MAATPTVLCQETHSPNEPLLFLSILDRELCLLLGEVLAKPLELFLRAGRRMLVVALDALALGLSGGLPFAFALQPLLLLLLSVGDDSNKSGAVAGEGRESISNTHEHRIIGTHLVEDIKDTKRRTNLRDFLLLHLPLFLIPCLAPLLLELCLGPVLPVALTKLMLAFRSDQFLETELSPSSLRYTTETALCRVRESSDQREVRKGGV